MMLKRIRGEMRITLRYHTPPEYLGEFQARLWLGSGSALGLETGAGCWVAAVLGSGRVPTLTQGRADPGRSEVKTETELRKVQDESFSHVIGT